MIFHNKQYMLKVSETLCPQWFPSYTFNGKEADSEAFGVVGSLEDYGMRMFDVRICMFKSPDPLFRKYPYYSTFQFAGDNPIKYIDIDGCEREEGIIDPFSSIYIGNMFMPEDMQIPIEEIWQAEMFYHKNAAVASTMVLAIELTLFAAAEVGVIATFKSMLTMGVTVGTVNSAISLINSEPAYEVAKSFASGFTSGTMLGLSPSTALPSILSTGFLSGMVGEYTNQIIDNEFGEGSGYDINKIIDEGGIGAFANVVSSKILEGGKKFIASKTEEAMIKVKSDSYRNMVKTQVKSLYPSLTGKRLSKIIDKRIDEAIKLIKAQDKINTQFLEKLLKSSEAEIKKKIEEKKSE